MITCSAPTPLALPRCADTAVLLRNLAPRASLSLTALSSFRLDCRRLSHAFSALMPTKALHTSSLQCALSLCALNIVFLCIGDDDGDGDDDDDDDGDGGGGGGDGDDEIMMR